MVKKELAELIGQALSFEDIQKIMKNSIGKTVKIIKLNDMCASKETIDEVLNENNDMAILYIPILSEYNGHFCSIFESHDASSIYFMDSYGSSPNGLMNIINDLGYVVSKTCLFNQMREKYRNGFMNTVQYQTKTGGVSDCGRYACANLIFKYEADMNGEVYDLNVFYKRMLELNKIYKTNDFDNSVTIFTQQFLD